jgi:hypothetical protein
MVPNTGSIVPQTGSIVPHMGERRELEGVSALAELPTTAALSIKLRSNALRIMIAPSVTNNLLWRGRVQMKLKLKLCLICIFG